MINPHLTISIHRHKTFATLFRVDFNNRFIRNFEGAKSLKMYGQYVPVRMEVVQVGSFSVHADRKEMIEWLKTTDTKPKVIYVVHGEESAAMNFRDAIADELNVLAVVPNDQEHVVL